MTLISRLNSRGVIGVSGVDRVSFLNGLVSNEVALVHPGRAVWAALLSPQGRYISDFFIFADGNRLLLDAPRAMTPDLVRRLSRFRLRAQVELQDLSESMAVYAVWDGMPPPVPVTASDPRLENAGYRMISSEPLEGTVSEAVYDAHRLSLGLPDGPPDLEPDKTLLLEAGFDELHGVAWDKGCYMGQELTARTKYRGLVKRRLVPVSLDSTPPAPGTPILAEGVEVGTLRSSAGLLGLAMLRIDSLQKPLIAGSALLKPELPAWMKLPGSAATA
jgi:folate-binding protein YgfZ